MFFLILLLVWSLTAKGFVEQKEIALRSIKWRPLLLLFCWHFFYIKNCMIWNIWSWDCTITWLASKVSQKHQPPIFILLSLFMLQRTHVDVLWATGKLELHIIPSLFYYLKNHEYVTHQIPCKYYCFQIWNITTE